MRVWSRDGGRGVVLEAWQYYYYIVSLCHANLWPKHGPTHFAEIASTIQYNYRKCGTHAQVFSQTLAHGNRETEIR